MPRDLLGHVPGDVLQGTTAAFPVADRPVAVLGARDGADQRRLPAAVGAEQTGDDALLDGQVETGEHRVFSIAHADGFKVEHEFRTSSRERGLVGDGGGGAPPAQDDQHEHRDTDEGREDADREYHTRHHDLGHRMGAG